MIRIEKYLNIVSWTTMLFLGTLIISCQPEEFGEGNGLDGSGLDADFTIIPVAGKVNTYLFEANKENIVGWRWNIGDGTGTYLGYSETTVFYPDAGEYNVTLTTIGKGGITKTSDPQMVVVLTSDPVAGNIVYGGKMNEDDAQYWTIFPISNGVTIQMNDGKVTASGGGWGQQGIYQAVELQANKKYKLNMTVSGSGASNVWFEVYLGDTEPVSNSDYNSGGILLGLNTWSGCGTTPFDGKLLDLACVGSLRASQGVIEFEQGGTKYLVIKSGGENLGTTGISIDNVELRGVSE